MATTKVISPGYMRTVEITDRSSSACGCGYSNINGSDPIDVKAFQNWANTNKNAGLDVDGKYGPLTKAAYNSFGVEWEASKSTKPASPAVSPVVTPEVKIPVTLTEKWKALSTTKKALVIGGGVLVTTGIIVLIWKLIPKK